MRALLLLLLISGGAQAAPFLVCDADQSKTADVLACQEGTVITRTPLVNSACRADLSAVTAGAHSLSCWFESSLWGTQSAAVPFQFARPASISSPASIRLAP